MCARFLKICYVIFDGLLLILKLTAIFFIGPGSVDLWQQKFLKSPENKIKINLTAGAAHGNGIKTTNNKR